VTPAQLAANETVRFITGRMKLKRARILDLGCGRGELAALLMELGAEVAALDKSEEAVLSARELGVPAICSDFLEFEGGRYDLIVCSRVLHHLSPLREALPHAAMLLAPGGGLVVEDFAFEDADRTGLTWFYGVERLLLGAGCLSDTLTSRADLADPVARWHAHQREYDVTSGTAMLEALVETFDLEAEARDAYLYRYAAAKLPADDNGAEMAAALIDWERALIATQAIAPVGVRWIARPKP